MAENREIEIRLLKVDVQHVTAQLKKAGAKELGELSFVRHIFDVVKGDASQWLRLRTDGNETTLTYKHRLSEDVDGTEEIEIKTDDIDKTLLLLNRLGFDPKSTQENKRTLFELNGAEVTIDLWPGLDPFVEIEAEDAAKIEELIKLLGLEAYERTTKTIKQLYSDKGVDITKQAILKF